MSDIADADDDDHHLLGKAGRANLLETLNAQGPQGIAEFQESQGLNSTSNVKPVLPLLDLHGVGRPDLYKKLLTMLRQQLMEKLPTLDEDNLNDLLSQTIPYIRIPELRPVALEVLKLHKDIPQYCLDLVAADQTLLDACGYGVKRQLWSKDPAQFLGVVSPLIAKYMAMIRTQSQSSDFGTVAKMAIRERRKAPEVAELVKCVGEEFSLYLALLQELRAGFLRTGDPGYGSLRTDLLLVLNETGVTGISRRDPCLHFARVLSGCAAGERREVDGPRAKELVRTAQSSVKDLSPSVLGDLGMTLIDPVIHHMLLSNLIRALKESIERRRLPKDNERLQALVTLLLIGSKARERIRSQDFSGNTSKEELELLKKVLPQLAGLMVEDAIVEADPTMDKEARGALPETLMRSITEHPFVGGAVMYYILGRLQNQNHNGGGPDVQGVVRTLPMLIDTVTGHWHHSPDDGSANVLEQFARTLLNRCRTKAVLSAAAKLDSPASPATRLFAIFLVPRAALSSDCHVQVLLLLKAIVRSHPEAAKKAPLVEIVRTICANGAEPSDLKSREAAALREAYEALLQSAMAGGDAEEPLEDRLVALTAPSAGMDLEMDDDVVATDAIET